ncbi:cytochrome P450 [Periconia macrospinosa]|uniref:Cytochrome P450 n=1 Tax=Periconia macrospinosa TaxID=97972 RepID=A0A2V1DHB9_9PLEO|nr:cytochrome P450 [Periconia macrospinosa]
MATTTLDDFHTLSSITRVSLRSIQSLFPDIAIAKAAPILRTFFAASLFLAFLYTINRQFSYDDGLPLVNRSFSLEPRIFSRWRWAFRSDKILNEAYEKYKGRPYRLARGDADIIVLPDDMIGELNKLPQSAISSRKSHSSSLTGYLNGMDVVKETNHHVKLLLARVTPALPTLLPSIKSRIEHTIAETLPQDRDSWTTIRPINIIVHCISQAVTLTTFGPPICDNAELILFSIMFVMRLVPRFLQPLLVWMTPFKWRLERSWRTLENFVIPEVEFRKEDVSTRCKNPDLISWMIAEAKSEEEKEGVLLTRLVGSVIAGGTYSSAAFITGVIADLVAHPQFLAEIRAEIKDTHERCGGKWDIAAFNSLDKLDSAMKETSRLAPGSMLVYSRYIEEPIMLSTGLYLKPGQFITTSGHSVAMDPDIFPNPRVYNALRAYEESLSEHRAQPFRSVDSKDHRWGAGRWACPGRSIASLASKVILVKLLDEYEFSFAPDQQGVATRPATQIMHEFVFMSPNAGMLIRRQKQSCGISY